MMRAILAGSAALVLAASPAVPSLYLINEAGVYAFIDAAGTRAITLPVTITQARPFSEGLAAIARRGPAVERWGFVNERGVTAIAPRFDSVGDFSEGLAAVVLGGRLGYIDTTGALVIQPQFVDDRLLDAAFSNGLAAVTDVHSQRGYIDRHGRLVIPFRYAFAAPFAGDRARVAMPGSGGAPSFGYIDRAGAWVVAARFSAARDFAEGLAAVIDGSHAAFVDTGGRTAITLAVQDLSPCSGNDDGMPGSFSEGLAAVRVGCQWGFIERTGATVIPPAYFNAGRFSGGVAPVNTGDANLARWGYIDRQGQTRIAAQFSTAAPFAGALALVQMGGSDEELMARALLRGLEDDAANASIKAQAKANIHPGTAMRKPEFAYVDTTGRVVWHHVR